MHLEILYTDGAPDFYIVGVATRFCAGKLNSELARDKYEIQSSKSGIWYKLIYLMEYEHKTLFQESFIFIDFFETLKFPKQKSSQTTLLKLGNDITSTLTIQSVNLM